MKFCTTVLYEGSCSILMSLVMSTSKCLVFWMPFSPLKEALGLKYDSCFKEAKNEDVGADIKALNFVPGANLSTGKRRNCVEKTLL